MSGQTIVLSILNECINSKVRCVETQQRATVSPQFYYNVFGIVKRLYNMFFYCSFRMATSNFFFMVQVVCAYDSLERYAEVEVLSFHVPTSSTICLQDEL
jgi:hypothetical protein